MNERRRTGENKIVKVDAPVAPNTIFVSYSHDDEDIVAALVSELEGKGFQVWHAGDKLAHLDPNNRGYTFEP